MDHTKICTLLGLFALPVLANTLTASPPEFEPALLSMAAPSIASLPVFRDLNGDGHLDVLYRTSNGFENWDFVVAFANAGAGFTPTNSFAIPGSVRSTGGDLNANGRPEIITETDGLWMIYEISPAGEIVPELLFFLPTNIFNAGPALRFFTNSAGSQNLFIWTQFPTKFFLIRTEPGGTFQPPVELPQLADLELDSNQPLDMNGDGASDIVGIGVDRTQLLAFESTPSGEFGPAIVSPLPPLVNPNEFRQVYAGFDWNADGIPDLLLSRHWQAEGPVNRFRFEVLSGRPDGRFDVEGPAWERDIGQGDFVGQFIVENQSGEVSFIQVLSQYGPGGGPAKTTSYEFVTVTAAGDVDIQPLPSDFGVYRGWSTSWGTPKPVIFGVRMISTDPLRADFTTMTLGEPQTLRTVLTDVPVTMVDPFVSRLDLDGDGMIELAVAGPDRITIFKNTGTPSDPVFNQYPNPFASIAAIAPAGGIKGELIAVGSAATPGTGVAAVLRRAPYEAIEAVASTPLPGPGVALTVLEEGPDDLRLAVVYDASPLDRLRIMTYSDSGGFTVVSDSELETGVVGAMASADLDVDGFLDIVVTYDRRTQSTLGGVLWGAPDGSFGPPSILQAQGSRRGLAVELMDLNQDGMPDIVVGCGIGAAVRAWTVGSDRTLMPSGAVDSVGTIFNGMTPGDFDHDGQTDVAFPVATRLVIARGDGVGGFEPPLDIDLGAPIASVAPVQAKPGQPDIIAVAFEDHTVRMYDGSGIAIDERVYATSAAPDLLRVIDIDGDRAPELIAASQSGYVTVLGGIPATCLADLAEPFGTLNFADVTGFLALFNAGDPTADLAPPFGSLNFSDLTAFLAAFNAGCP